MVDRVAPDLRALMRGFPHGVAVLTVDAGGQRLGLTIGSLVSLSLDPPMIGVAIAKQAAMHELLREAGGGALGWLEFRLAGELDAGDHTFFAGEVLSVELGEPAPPLVHIESGYRLL